MRNKFWMTCCSRCKVCKKNIIILTDIFAFKGVEFSKCRVTYIFAALCKVQPERMLCLKFCTHALVNSKRRNSNKSFKRRTFLLSIFYVSKKFTVINCNNSLNISGITAENDVFFCKHVSCRNNGSTNFVKSYNRNPEFITSLQDEHNKISAFNSDTAEVCSGTVCAFFKKFFVIIITPDKCSSIWTSFCQNINYVITEVEVFRHFYFVVFKKIFIICKLCSF